MTAHPPARSAARAPDIEDPQPWRVSREEYYRLAEQGYFDGKRVERIHGEVRLMSPTNWPHVVATIKIRAALEVVFRDRGFISGTSPFPTSSSDPEPDIAVVPGKPGDYHDHPTQVDLIVEVANTSLTFDTTVKARIYAAAGVADYWVVDLNNRTVHVFREPRADAASESGWAYSTCTQHGPGDSITPLAAQAAVAVDDLLP